MSRVDSCPSCETEEAMKFRAGDTTFLFYLHRPVIVMVSAAFAENRRTEFAFGKFSGASRSHEHVTRVRKSYGRKHVLDWKLVGKISLALNRRFIQIFVEEKINERPASITGPRYGAVCEEQFHYFVVLI